MRLKLMLAAAVLSIGGFTPAPLGGQFVDTPRNFHAFADGDDIVARWLADGDANFYIVELDDDSGFSSPSRWSVRAAGKRTFDHRVRNLPRGIYYVRVRAVDTILFISQQSPWTHIERVVIGRGTGWRPDRDDRDSWESGDRDFPRSDEFPRRIDARAFGDDIRVTWSPVLGAERYLLQVDNDRSFRSPSVFGVEAWEDRATQEFLIRNAPRGRYYIRVRAVDRFVAWEPYRWSGIEVIDLRFRDGGIFRREAEFRDGRRSALRPAVRRHPVFAEHPGQGKGHLKHEGKKHNPGHERDPDHDLGDDD